MTAQIVDFNAVYRHSRQMKKQTSLGFPLPKHPKRLSLDENLLSEVAFYNVFFRGVQQRYCTVADVEKGYVTRFIVGSNGLCINGRNGIPMTETLQGEVRIELNERAARIGEPPCQPK